VIAREAVSGMHLLVAILSLVVPASVEEDARAQGPEPDVEVFVEWCRVALESEAGAAELPSRADLVSILARSRGKYELEAQEFLTRERIQILVEEGDELDLYEIGCLVQLLIDGGVGRDWIRRLLLDAIELLHERDAFSYGIPDDPRRACIPLPTAAETEWIQYNWRRTVALRDLIARIIDHFRDVHDCRLADDLVGLVGYSSVIDSATVRYLNVACAGDGLLAQRVQSAVEAIPWSVQARVVWRGALQLVSAVRRPIGYISPVERIRSVWHAPLFELDRMGVGRDLVEEEKSQIDIVNQLPESHILAMAELFESMDWSAAPGSAVDARQSIEVRAMLAMLSEMRTRVWRQMIAEWYVAIDGEAPERSSAINLRWAILETLGHECVPSLALWIVSQLSTMELRAERGDTRSVRFEIDSAVAYVMNCVEIMPDIRSTVLQLAVDRRGTFLSTSIQRQFGADARNNEGGSAARE